jgi:hypothetical protein
MKELVEQHPDLAQAWTEKSAVVQQ